MNDEIEAATDEVVAQYVHLKSKLGKDNWNVETVGTLCAIAILDVKRRDEEIADLRKCIADAVSPEGVERAWKAYCTNGSCSPSVSTLFAIKAALGEMPE